MNTWTTEAIVSVGVPVLGILNAWLLVQIRVEITGLKLEILQQRVEDRDELRKWVESEYLRKTEVEARMQTLEARFDRLENRRRDDRAA